MKRHASLLLILIPFAAMWLVHVATRPLEGARRRLPVAATVGGRRPAVQRDSTRLWPERSVALGGDAGRQLVHQCSRPAPDAARVAGTWTPSATRLARFDSLLTRRLRAELDSLPRPPKVADYFRQFVGLDLSGRRVIYVNGFAGDPASGWFPAGWRGAAVVACDGGWGFFGAEYDLEGDSLAAFHFNGVG